MNVAYCGICLQLEHKKTSPYSWVVELYFPILWIATNYFYKIYIIWHVFPKFFSTAVPVPPSEIWSILIVMPYGLPDTNKHFMLPFKIYLINKQLDCSEMSNLSLTKSKVTILQTLVPGTKEMWRQVKPPKTYSTYKLRYFGFMIIFWPSRTTSKYNTR
jgi:hypothetical protein